MSRGYRPASLVSFLSLAGIVALIAWTIAAAVAPWVLPGGHWAARRLAAGGLDFSIDRAGITLVGAALMVASGAMPLEDACKSIDIYTRNLACSALGRSLIDEASQRAMSPR